MFRIDNSTAASSLPTPAAAGTPGFFADGVPGTTPATVVPADWFNAVQEELAGVVTAAGITLSKTNRAQLLAALRILFSAPLFSTVNNVLASRAQTTVYTNTTGRPMWLSVVATSGAVGSNIVLSVNSLLAFQSAMPSTGFSESIGCVIPPGATYQVAASGGAITITAWLEVY